MMRDGESGHRAENQRGNRTRDAARKPRSCQVSGHLRLLTFEENRGGGCRFPVELSQLLHSLACENAREQLPIFPVAVAASVPRPVQRGGLMPLLRYCLVVGGILLTLLLLAGRYMTGPMGGPESAQAEQDSPIIRVQSAQKWPEKIVFDTSAPQIRAPDVAPAVVAPSEPGKTTPTVQEAAREAFALAAQPSVEPRRATPPLRARRTPERRHRHQPARAVARNQFPFFGGPIAAQWW